MRQGKRRCCCLIWGKSTSPVADRQLTPFFCAAKRKGRKKKPPRFTAPAGYPRSAAIKRGCATRPGGAHTPRPTAGLEQCSPKPPLPCGRSRRRTGDEKRKPKTQKTGGQQVAHQTKVDRQNNSTPVHCCT